MYEPQSKIHQISIKTGQTTQQSLI